MAAAHDSSIAARSKQWYDDDISEVDGPIRALLEGYAKVPPKDVVAHVNEFRARAFAVNPYPCIGHYRFLNLTLLSHPLYPDILKRLRDDADSVYLDLGCCFGQDMRQLVADGVPSTQLIGLDIEAPLIELGYELFKDRDTLKSQFVVADVFAGGATWAALQEKKADIIHCSAFFHLFPLQHQTMAALNISSLVRPNGIIVGRQSGSITPREYPGMAAGSTSYRHDVDSFQGVWNVVGTATETEWKVTGSLDRVGMVSKNNVIEDENSRRLLFTVTRLR